MLLRFKSVFLSAALGLSTVLAPVHAAADTLADALAGAYRHSGLLEQNRALLRAADEDVAIQIASTRPIVNWSLHQQTSFSHSGSSLFSSSNSIVDVTASISAELLIYDFGATQFAIDAAKENVLATRERLVAIEQQVLLESVRAFMNVRREAENVALRQNNVRLITQELRAARDRFEVGEVTRTDVSLAEARLAAARSALAAAQGSLAREQHAYVSAVGRKPGALAAPSRLPKTANSLAAARAQALKGHPDMHRVQHEARAADLNVMRAEASMKPSVNLTGRASVNRNLETSSFRDSASLTLGVGGPIYHGGRLSALYRQSMARADSARAQLHITKHALEQQVGVAFAQLQVARASREASDRQIRAARVAFRGVREEAKLGSRTTLDVLNAEQELLNAEAGMISAIADEYIASYSLLAAMGLLTVYHLGLNVERYDPAAYYNLVKDAPTLSSQGEDLDRVLRAIGKD